MAEEQQKNKKENSALEQALNNMRKRKKKCPHCGMLLLDEAKFCKNCGLNLNK